MKTLVLWIVGMALLLGIRADAEPSSVLPQKSQLPTAAQPAVTQPNASVPRFPTNPPQVSPGVNALTRIIGDKCTDAKPWVAVCNLCQETITKLKEQCQAEKDQLTKTTSEQCAQSTSGAATDAYQRGVQDGIADLKNKVKSGYIFEFVPSTGSCEAFCSHVRADDGHMMTCAGSITITGGCLSPARLVPGPCTGHASDAHCICA